MPKQPAPRGKTATPPISPTASGRLGKPGVEIANYSAAIRWLLERTDIERMRVVNYTDDMFNSIGCERCLRSLVIRSCSSARSMLRVRTEKVPPAR